MLADSHPAVRMNTATHLVRIWDLDQPGFWGRASKFIAEEENRAVLDTFLARTLGTLIWHGAAREAANLVLPLLDRFPIGDPRNGAARSHLIQMTLQFWLRFHFPDAKAKVDSWVATSVNHAEEVCESMRWFRDAYTAGLRGPDDKSSPIDRSQAISVISQVVIQASEEIASYRDFTSLSEAQTARAKGAAQIIDTACQMLYFGSGAFANQNSQNTLAPMTSAGMLVFFNEIAPTLRRIGDYPGPRTLYNLMQLLEYLIEAEPAGVFDLLAHAVQRGGQEGGYQFESLGADLIAKLARIMHCGLAGVA